MSSSSFEPEAEGWEMLPATGFIDLVGPIWSRERDGGLGYGFVAEPKHANLVGVVQGGMLMTFADRCMGLAAWESVAQRPSVTLQFDAQFVTAARIGEFVQADCELVRSARGLIFMRGRLLVGARIVLTASGIWKTLGDRRSQGTPPGRGRQS